MLKTLKNLALAMLNATLILIVLCLFLAWKVTDKAEPVADEHGTLAQLGGPIVHGIDSEVVYSVPNFFELPEHNPDDRPGPLYGRQGWVFFAPLL